MNVSPASDDKPPVKQRKQEDANRVNLYVQTQEAEEPQLERTRTRHSKITLCFVVRFDIISSYI